MDSSNVVALKLLTGESVNYGIFFNLFVWVFTLSSVQDRITVTIPLG